MTRLASRDDLTEDMFLAIRELVERFGVSPREVRRLTTLAIRGTPPATIQDRILEGGGQE